MKETENKRHSIEVADIFEQYGQEYLSGHRLCIDQYRSFHDIINCRTAVMGGHLEQCDQCHYERPAFNSCRNRHCPRCQYGRQQDWVEKLVFQLPRCRYYHLVFTVPSLLHKLFYINQKQCYSLLFNAASQALKQVASNPDFLGAQTGAVAILHTWGQALTYHPHVHMIVPAGGLSSDHVEWVKGGKKFFLPVRALSKIYRAIFCKQLSLYFQQAQLNIPAGMDEDFSSLQNKLYEKDWNVYLKRARGGATGVVKYLGRYTHRVAISNSRLLSIKEGRVDFFWKDYRKNGQRQIMSLKATEFIQRFMMHILPNGFYKIRYYGIFSSKCSNMLAIVHHLLSSDAQNEEPVLLEVKKGNSHRLVSLCPQCKKGKMTISNTILKKQPPS